MRARDHAPFCQELELRAATRARAALLAHDASPTTIAVEVGSGSVANRTAREILTRPAFENALRVLAALSGSTNAVVHLLALAGRAGVALTLDDFDRIARQVPLLVDCKPAGRGYMEDFHRAGGVPALLKAMESPVSYTHLTLPTT